MPFHVLLLGAYGLFGTRIAQRLAREADWQLTLAGRHLAAAEGLCRVLHADERVRARCQATAIDAHGSEFRRLLETLQPHAVIHCAGPFQQQDYRIAQQCVAAGVHYIDLADARGYVSGFAAALDAPARAQRCLAVTGASTVPGLSAAVIDHFRAEFAQLDHVDIGISPGNRTERGLATVAAILSYVGRPVPWWHQHRRDAASGWQRLQRWRYPDPVGTRWLSACDVPDLDLFPARYGLQGLTFRAGLELTYLHLGLWALSWLVRAGLIRNLAAHASLLKRLSEWFAGAGSDNGAMHVQLRGLNARGQPQQRLWQIVAQAGDGPHIPATAAVVIARKLASGALSQHGATACLDLFTLEEFLAALDGYSITTDTR